MKRWIACLLLCWSSVFAETMTTGVINLHYQTAEALLPLLKPLLQPGEKITGGGQQLIVSVSNETLDKLNSVIHKLDVPPAVLMVSIHQGSANWVEQDSSQAVVYSSNPETAAGDSQSVTVNSGSSAFVSIGNNRPVISAVGGGAFNQGVEYQRDQTTEGFYVIPTLQGNEVKVVIKRIRQRQDQTNQDQDQTGGMETTMMVPLDKWTSIGSAANSGSGTNQDSVNYSAGASYEDTSTLFIKVHQVQD